MKTPFGKLSSDGADEADGCNDRLQTDTQTNIMNFEGLLNLHKRLFGQKSLRFWQRWEIIQKVHIISP